IFPDLAGQPASEERAAAQFGHVVLIEPSIGGELQWDVLHRMETDDPDYARLLAMPQADIDAIVPPPGHSNEVALAAMADPAASYALFGADLGAVPQLLPDGRGTAFRFEEVEFSGSPDIRAGEAALERRFGALGPGDAYFRASRTPA